MRLTVLALSTTVALTGAVEFAAAKVVYQRGGEIIVAGNSGGSERRLTTGAAPTPSPDGRWVAFLGRQSSALDAAADLFVVPTRGGRARKLLDDADGASWDPTSRMIVSEGARGLVRVGPHIRRPRVVDRDIRDTGDKSFAPDGRLAVAWGGGLVIYDSGLNRDSARELARGAFAALWGRGGLAYTWTNSDPKEPGGTLNSRSELRLIPPGGRATTLLSPGAEPVAWSTDGRRLLVQSGETSSVVRISPRSNTQISQVGTVDDLSADGRTALVSREDGLHAISVGSGRDRLIAPSGSSGKYITPPRPPTRRGSENKG